MQDDEQGRTMAHKLQLENMALEEELQHSEAQIRALEQQLAAHKTFGGQPSSDPHSALLRHKEAEVATSKRLIQRLASRMAAFDPAAPPEEDASARFFTLDASFVADGDSSTGDVSVTGPRSVYLRTPNGKTKLPRAFEADLVDDIETLRATYEESSRRILFTNAEQKVALAIAESHNAQLREQLAAPPDTTELTALRDEVQHLRSEVASAADLESQLVQSQATTQQAHDRIAVLETSLAASTQKREQAQLLLAELAQKRERLHSIQLHQTQVDALEKLVALQGRMVQMLDERADLGATAKAALQVYTHEFGHHISAFARLPASTEAAQEDGRAARLAEQVGELEQRVLRRTEQIGSQQRRISELENDLARTRTNQVLAEETVEELDAEAAALRTHIAQLAARTDTAPMPDTLVELESSQARVRAQAEELDTLAAQLETVERALQDLLSTKITLEANNAALRQQIASALPADNAELIDQHELELKSVRTALRKAEEKSAALALEVDALQLSVAEHRESASEDADRLADLQDEMDTLRLASAEREELQQQVVAANALLETAKADTAAREELEGAVGQLRAQIEHLERLLSERDAALRERNAEYWTLKEEVAELQEAAETSRDSNATPQLAALQGELAAVQTDNAELQTRIDTQEKLLLQFKRDAASARATEDMLNQQYTSAQARLRDLESTVHELEARVPADSPELPAAAQEEQEYLRSRVEQLEAELSAKADEIEEADSKILDALKEAKKYATRYTKLTAKYEAVQTQLTALSSEGGKAAPTAEVSSMVMAGRKRAKPDDEAVQSEVQAPAAEVGAKVVYAPSPHQSATATTLGNGFTPVRRTGTGAPPASDTAGMTRSTSNPSELIAARLSPTKPTATPTTTPGRAKLGERTNLPATGTTTVGGVSRLSSNKAPTAKPAPIDKPAAVSKKVANPVLPPSGATQQPNAAGFLARMKAAQLRTTTA